MEAPNKIYATVQGSQLLGCSTNPYRDCEEYIRKDALLEWLEQNRNQVQMWFDKYGDRLDGAAKQVWEEVIGKLNEM